MLRLVAALVTARRGRRILAVLLVALAAAWMAASAHPGAVIASARDLESRLAAQRLDVVGRFGTPSWPALLIGRELGEGEVDLIAPSGQRHVYRGFDRPMQALTLLGPHGRFAVVAAQKRPARHGPLER